MAARYTFTCEIVAWLGRGLAVLRANPLRRGCIVVTEVNGAPRRYLGVWP